MTYHVDTPDRLELIRVALDKANGVRDADGNPTPRRARIFRRGVEVTGHPHWDPNERGVFAGTRTVCPEVIMGDDGTAALELPDTPEISRHLGKRVHGIDLPARGALKAEAAIPARVRAVLEKKRAEAAERNRPSDGPAPGRGDHGPRARQ